MDDHQNGLWIVGLASRRFLGAIFHLDALYLPHLSIDRQNRNTDKESVVAQFCTQCGTEAASETEFCPSCGAPMAATAAAITSATASPATPAKQDMSAVKIILIVVVCVFGLGILGLGGIGFLIFRAARGIHVHGPNDGATVNMPGGSIAANSSDHFSASDLGIDIYPGARTGRRGMRMSLPNASTISAVYLTDDSRDQVVSFYKSRLGPDATVIDNAGSTILSLNKGQKENIVVAVITNYGDEDGKTKINIVHSASNKQ